MFLEDYENITDCIVLDTETVTDQASRISKVWELGLVVIKNSQIVDTKEWLIAPDAKFERLDLFYPEGHITIDEIKASPRFENLYSEFEQYLHPDFIIGGHNVDYDLRVLNHELVKLNKPLIGKHKVDTIRLARRVHPEWTRYNLDTLSKHYGLDIEKRHRALDDAYATAIAFLKMRETLMKPKEHMGLF